MERVLLFYSGGNDSTLSACILASKGYDVQLITFDNGSEEGIENIRNRATILERLFMNSKNGKVHNLGVFPSVSVFMRMRYQTINMSFSEMINKYGDLNQNQINCLNCRSAMYAVGVAVARRLGIKYVADGARKSQLFAIEQESILDKYSEVLNNYGIELLLPVFNYLNDSDVVDKLWSYSLNFYNIVYKDTYHYESKCFLGCPMDRMLTDEEINSYVNYFDDVIKPIMIENIELYPNSVIDEQVKKPVYTKYRFK